jgi:hypothetical protein
MFDPPSGDIATDDVVVHATDIAKVVKRAKELAARMKILSRVLLSRQA